MVLLDSGDNDIADVGISSGGTAQYTNAKDLLGAGIVSHLQSAFLLDHADFPPFACPGLLRAFHDLDQSPPFVLGQRSGLHDTHGISDLAFIVLIVCFQLVGLFHDLLIQRMLHMILDGHDNGLVHLIARDFPDTRFSQISFFHDSLLSGSTGRRFVLCDDR